MKLRSTKTLIFWTLFLGLSSLYVDILMLEREKLFSPNGGGGGDDSTEISGVKSL